MAAARVIGRESEQAADCGEWDRLAAAVEEAGIKARFSAEAVEVRAEFHQDGVDRPRDIGMDDANGRGRLSPVGTLVRGSPVRAYVGQWSDRGEHGRVLLPSVQATRVFAPDLMG